MLTIGERFDDAAYKLCEARGLNPEGYPADPAIRMTNFRYCRQQIVAQYEILHAIEMAGLNRIRRF